MHLGENRRLNRNGTGGSILLRLPGNVVKRSFALDAGRAGNELPAIQPDLDPTCDFRRRVCPVQQRKMRDDTNRGLIRIDANGQSGDENIVRLRESCCDKRQIEKPQGGSGSQGLIDIPENVFDILQADRHTDQVRRNSSRKLLSVGELLVRSRSRMND